MAIIKLMHINECSKHNPAQHLKNSIKYITNSDKTQNGRLIGSINCTKNAVYQEMLDVKRQFGKETMRQGYHFVISFVPREVDANTAYKITQRIIERYLQDYQTVFAVHDDKEHIHSHIIFNSVSWITGLKYHYQNGEWEKIIQPLLNELCKEYHLSTINLEELHTKRERKGVHYAEWKAEQEGKSWRKQVLEVVKEIAAVSMDMEEFLKKMQEQGYLVKNKKHISFLPADGGKHRPVRFHAEEIWKLLLKSGDNYYYHSGKVVNIPKVRKTYIPWKSMSKLQKNYIRKLYQLGRIKKYRKNYIRKDEERFQQLQEEYRLISRYPVNASVYQTLKEKFQMEALQIEEEQKIFYKERSRWKGAFLMLQMSRDIKDERMRKAILNDIEQRYGAIEALTEMEKRYANKVQGIQNKKKEISFMIEMIEKIEKLQEEKENQNKDQEKIEKYDKKREQERKKR